MEEAIIEGMENDEDCEYSEEFEGWICFDNETLLYVYFDASNETGEEFYFDG